MVFRTKLLADLLPVPFDNQYYIFRQKTFKKNVLSSTESDLSREQEITTTASYLLSHNQVEVHTGSDL